MKTKFYPLVLFPIILLLAGCGERGRQTRGSNSNSIPEAVTETAAVPENIPTPMTILPGDEYNPNLNPDLFTTNITNPYFSLPIGKEMVYESQTEEGLETIIIMVPGWTRTVAGVETLVFWDRVYLDGELIEDTRDYVAQNKETGDVWYFGEHVDNYEDGVIADHDGAWLTGEDNAKPGIWALANPQVGDKFRNEYRVGEAEDESEVLAVNETVTVPFGTFTGCVKHLDGSPLFDAKAHAYLCPDAGAEVFGVDLASSENLEEVTVELVKIDPIGAIGVELPEAYIAEDVIPALFTISSNMDCTFTGETAEIADAKLYIEFNATDEDLGIHGYLGDDGWSELCVYNPADELMLAIKPQAQLKGVTMASVFFEGREPSLDEFGFEDLQSFPEGEYEVRALSYDGTVKVGAATFSQAVPVPPALIYPAMAEEENAEGVIVPTEDLVVEWADVTETVAGVPVTIIGYEVIITKVKHDDPHGFSQPIYDVHVSPDHNSLSVPAEFLEAGTLYELEILALEETGNQTITVSFFTTK